MLRRNLLCGYSEVSEVERDCRHAGQAPWMENAPTAVASPIGRSKCSVRGECGEMTMNQARLPEEHSSMGFVPEFRGAQSLLQVSPEVLGFTR